jgi:phage gpG-like protein
MKLHELSVRIEKMTDELLDYAQNIAPHDIGEEAVEFYREAFQQDKKGFTDRALVKWKELKRPNHKREPGSEKGRSNILVKSTNLSRSIEARPEQGKVTVHAEAFSKKGFNYAPVHNSGDKNIPQRKFIGESETLNKKIVERLKEKAAEIIRNA